MRRDTDGKLTVVVAKRAGAEDQVRVIDRERGRLFEGTHATVERVAPHPRLVAAHVAADAAARRRVQSVVPMDRPNLHGAAGECRWYQVGGDQPSSRICWSARLKLPLVVEQATHGGTWSTVVTVDSVGVAPISAAIFAPSSDGLARVSLDADVD